MRRLATAAVLAPALWALVKLAPLWAFVLVASLAIVVACWECYRLLEACGARPFKIAGIVAAAAIAWSSASQWSWTDPATPLIALLPVTAALAMALREGPKQMLDALSSTVFPVAFVALTLAYLIALREIPGHDGEDLVLLVLVCVIFADAGAYYVGRSWGRRRLAPSISPKKTWEGLAGGLAAGMAGALLAHFWFYQRLALHHALILGLLLTAAGVLGDLAESVLKRAAGVKDSSALLPGHGGLLDRTDSLLFAGPLLYYYHRFFL